MTRNLTDWDDARTLDDLGELTARWLEGDIDSHPSIMPGHGPDTETSALIPLLTTANRHGYVTHFSQPGTLWEDGGQRAAVAGYCTEVLAEKLRQFGVLTDLVVLATPPGYENPVRVPISADDAEATCWAGFAYDADEIAFAYRDVHQHALAELAMSWQVTLIDPQWGREALLWEHLATVFA